MHITSSGLIKTVVVPVPYPSALAYMYVVITRAITIDRRLLSHRRSWVITIPDESSKHLMRITKSKYIAQTDE